jgi:arylsulfate sulfotransferase
MANAVHIRKDSLISQQSEREKEFLSRFKQGVYTPQNPLVIVNPYMICPCTALIMFITAEETAVTLTVRGKEPCADISHTFPRSKVHMLPVLGLYPDFENTVVISLYQGPEYTIRIKTEKTDSAPAKLISMETSYEYLGSDLIFVSPVGNPDRLTGFDYNGDVRWYTTILLNMAIKRLSNGRLLVGGDQRIAPPYYAASIYELDLLGKIYNEYIIPGGYHHDQFEMPNGDLLVLTQGEDAETVEDMCVLIDRKTGEIKKSWDYKNVITPGDGSSVFATKEDWYHNNAVWYDENTNSLSLSGRHIDAIVNLDYDSGKINWILGNPEGWSEDKRKYFFTPIAGKPFDWQYAQHAASVLPCGDILCFDNGTGRSKNKIKDKNQNPFEKDGFSRAVRYRINTETMTIGQVWEYGRERGPDFFSAFICNTEYYGKDHYLIHSGGVQHADGVPGENIPEGQVPNFRRESVTICVVNDVKKLEMHLESNFYRAARLSLYHKGSSFCIGEGKTLGKFGETKTTDTPDIKGEGKPLKEECVAHVIEHPEYMEFLARFEPERNVTLVLSQAGKLRCYKVITGAHPMPIDCSPYLDINPNNTGTLVKKTGLSGQYDVNVIIDGELFYTGLTINCQVFIKSN